MRGFGNGLILGIILGAVGFWFVQKKAREHPEAQQRYKDSASQAGAALSQAANNMSDALRAKLDTLDLSADKIKDELSRTGQIFRRKAHDIGDKATDAASDSRAVTDIKAKFASDQTLSTQSISVACDQGHVTLSGSVSTQEDIGKAVALALEVDGVRDVKSTLQAKSP
jgi:hyperosmotically inducible periplasmic protein